MKFAEKIELSMTPVARRFGGNRTRGFTFTRRVLYWMSYEGTPLSLPQKRWSPVEESHLRLLDVSQT